MAYTTNVPGHLTPYAFETITVSTTAVALDPDLIFVKDSVAEKDLGKARLARITVEDLVRFREDGVDPTDAIGHELRDGDVYDIASYQAMLNFRAIRHADQATDATLRVTYYR